MKKTKYLQLALLAMLASCAKEMPKEKLVKGIHEAGKAELPCTTKKCIYVPSVVETPREVSATRPHWMGDAKLVVAKITEKSLNFLETEKDERFQDNNQNLHPVLSIPVTHKDYKCKENEYGQCGHKEEEDKDKRWNQKRSIDIDFNSLSVNETNFLPIQLENLFGSCYQEVGQRVTDVKMNKHSINVEMEKTYKVTDISCPDQIKSLSHLSFNVKYHYSLIEVDQVASEEYTPVLYSKKSENTFGFFSTDHEFIDVDNRNTLGTELKLLNRWNPKRSTIPYLLSDNFFKEENKVLLESTKAAIKKVNDSLALANTSFKITLEKANGRKAADLKNNVIALVEDPQASGIIGYGPSITNPATGEIIHARTVMYAGTIKKFIRRGYEELLELKEEVEVPSKDQVKQAADDSEEVEDGKKADVSKVVYLAAPVKKVQDHKHNPFAKDIADISMKKLKHNLLHHNHTHQKKELTHKLLKNIEEFKNQNDLIDTLSENNYYHASNFNFVEAIKACETKEVLKKKLGGELQPWANLNTSQKKVVLDTFMPCVWIPTLVHEFGHNLGLRHNFNGSEDKDNYYTKQELKDMKINREITYSSIMDYSYSNINELPIMGKYDVAALRFGYAREVEMTDGGLKSVSMKGAISNNNMSLANIDVGNIEHVEKSIEVQKKQREAKIESEIATLKAELTERYKDLDPKAASVVIAFEIQQKRAELEKEIPAIVDMKSYQFCTDEHVSVNAGCNRFDEGSTLAEIANHYVISFKKGYKRRNLRGDRESFSIYDDASYFRRVYYTMRGLRLFFELYDRLTGMYPEQLKPDSPLWEQLPFLKEIKEATHTAGNFFVDTIKTPGLHCMVQLPSGGMAIAPIADLNKDSTTCFDSENIQLNPGFTVMAEIGKNINNKKDPRNSNPYMDQIDVRGIWMDKVLATYFLTTRELGSSIFDKFTKNFLDIPEFRQKTVSTVSELMLDQIKTNKVDITLADGTVIAANDPANPFNTPEGYTFNISSDHLVSKSLHRGVNRMFGLSAANTNILSPMVDIFNLQGASRDDIEDSSALLKMFRVTKTISNTAGGVEKQDELIINSGRYIALGGNTVASANISLYKKIEKADEIKEADLAVALEHLKDPSVLEKKQQAQLDAIKVKLDEKTAELQEELKDDPEKDAKIEAAVAELEKELKAELEPIESKNIIEAKKLGLTFLEMMAADQLPSKNYLVEVLGLLPDNFVTADSSTL